MPDTTTTTSPALPEGSILDAICTSCTRVLDRYLTNQEYDLSGVETYLNELNSDESRVDTAMVEARRKNTPATLPLRFEQLEDELTVYALLELSQEVLSSHSSIIQSMTERTAEDIALFGTMSLYIGDQQLTTQRISNISASDISSYFGLPLQREVPHPTMSFVTIGERAPTWDCVMSLRQLFSNLAAKLQTSGFSSLGEAVKAAAEHAKDYAIANNNGANDPVTISVDRFIYELCTRVDAFNDAAILHGEAVYFFSAAQRLTRRLCHRFDDPTEYDGIFRFENNATYTVQRPKVLAQLFVQRQWLYSDTSIQSAEQGGSESESSSLSTQDLTPAACVLAIIERERARLTTGPLASIVAPELETILSDVSIS